MMTHLGEDRGEARRRGVLRARVPARRRGVPALHVRDIDRRRGHREPGLAPGARDP